jgi:cytoskeletal protein RodZ
MESLPEPLTGKSLKGIREQLGISLEEISTRTRIHLPYLEFIEGDRYDKLPHEVYLRGYLIHYARVMGLDAHRVVQGYLKRALEGQNQDH